MSRHSIRIEQDFAVSVEAVYAQLSDHDRLASVFGVPCRRIRNGDAELNGTGSVRRIGVWPLALEETVVAAEPNKRIDYRISRGGAPLKNHRGQLTFTSTPTGSHVLWEINFTVPLPLVGHLIEKTLAQGIRRGLRKSV